MSNVKMVIIVRNDLKMNKGKLAGQVAHASLAIILDKMKRYQPIGYRTLYLKNDDPMEIWLSGKFTKVILKCESLEELVEIHKKAKISGLSTSLITDCGDTVFYSPTITCCAIGPDYSEIIDKLTGHLRLL